VKTDSIHLDRDGLKFLRELEKHNNREWFQGQKERYERSLRDPVVAFVGALAPRLAKLSKQFVVDARPVGGSVSRIHRDVRFSADKSPYKTGVFAHFRHGSAEKGGAPGFYLHIEPGRSAAGGGVWQPEPPALKKIRDGIVTSSQEWKRATSGVALGSTCSMSGASLKRVPPGYDPSHPHAEDLKRKDFAVSTSIADDDLVGDGAIDAVAAALKNAAPLVKFVSRALGIPY
jgi:uncharacterized protein (TIGR02453 family)